VINQHHCEWGSLKSCLAQATYRESTCYRIPLNKIILCGTFNSGFDSRRYQIFWEAVGLEPGPLSLVSTIEELLERKSSGFGLENRDPSRWPRGTLYSYILALTSPTSGGRSIGIVRSRTQATEFLLFCGTFNDAFCSSYDRLCGPVVRVLGYRSGGPGSIPGTTRKKK
jgi:hypothetical protein